MILTIIIFVLILGLLILVHELGHFITAKRAGVKIEEFGFGYPPKIFGIKKGETTYSLNLLPFGGFVRICGENGPEVDKVQTKDEQRAFYNKPIGKRAKIIVAGVIMNVILAMVLLSFGYWLGLPAVVEDVVANDLRDVKIQITQVAFETPAEEAEISIGDTIKELQFSGEVIVPEKIEDVQNFISSHLGEQIIVVIERGDEVLNKEIVPRMDYPENEGSIGVGLARTAIVSYSWYKAIYMGVINTINLLWLVAIMLAGIIWQLLMAGKVAAEIAGPVGIFNLTGQATQLGFIYVLQLTALLSINLAIINIIPFPALDGGRLLFLIIEKIKGSPVSRKIEGIIHTSGFIFLILLIIAITWRDVVRLF
ncbi:MAG: site-2 protease family protein [bacterium]